MLSLCCNGNVFFEVQWIYFSRMTKFTQAFGSRLSSSELPRVWHWQAGAHRGLECWGFLFVLRIPKRPFLPWYLLLPLLMGQVYCYNSSSLSLVLGVLFWIPVVYNVDNLLCHRIIIMWKITTVRQVSETLKCAVSDRSASFPLLNKVNIPCAISTNCM